MSLGPNVYTDTNDTRDFPSVPTSVPELCSVNRPSLVILPERETSLNIKKKSKKPLAADCTILIV